MSSRPQKHTKHTKILAHKLAPSDIYDWLVTDGYYPESYVLPPCFHVSKHPRYKKRYARPKNKKFTPKIAQICELYFPKSNLTDRTFGIIDPEIHSDIAYEIATNWGVILNLLFNSKKKIYSYSFPIPLSYSTPGTIGGLRAGRMIYEWIEMAENDLAEEAYSYKYLVRTDVKNFYPSIYTHSIAWAIHSKSLIRSKNNRYNIKLLGNRLDKLFQCANDGCTNGLPIGPVASDLMSEILLSAVDLAVSSKIGGIQTLALRFKDDYRFLCKTEEDCKRIIKVLQKELKEFNLLLNEEKTIILELPEGIFREWVSKYHPIRPKRGKRLTYKEFKELYLNVLRIDKENPGTGVIDRFIADITDDSYEVLFSVSKRDIQKMISLLLLLANRRIKTLPKVLGVIEAVMFIERLSKPMVEKYFNSLLRELSQNTEDNRYLISWILYFMKSNKLKVKLSERFSHSILKSLQLNRNHIFKDSKDFKLYRSIFRAKKSGNLLEYLDVFKPQ